MTKGRLQDGAEKVSLGAQTRTTTAGATSVPLLNRVPALRARLVGPAVSRTSEMRGFKSCAAPELSCEEPQGPLPSGFVLGSALCDFQLH